MGGVEGVLTQEFLDSRSRYLLYTVKLHEGREVRVPSRLKFEEGDCVVISVPETAIEDAYFIPGEASMAKGSGCSVPDA